MNGIILLYRSIEFKLKYEQKLELFVRVQNEWQGSKNCSTKQCNWDDIVKGHKMQYYFKFFPLKTRSLKMNKSSMTFDEQLIKS